MQLSEVLDIVAGLPTKDREKVLGLARKSMATRLWVPNVGPQTEAYYSEADEIFYGGDKQRFKGDSHDLIVFDEGTDFLESQYRFIIGWNRSTDPNQRCRVVVTSNPPTTAGFTVALNASWLGWLMSW
jgi:hypothetical protein